MGYYRHAPLDYFFQALSPSDWARWFITSLAPLSLLPLIFAREAFTFLRANRYLVIYGLAVFGAALFGGDNERLVAPWFIPWYLWLGLLLAKHWEQHRWPVMGMGLGVLVSTLHHSIARFPPPDRNWTVGLTLACLGAASALAIWIQWREMRT